MSVTSVSNLTRPIKLRWLKPDEGGRTVPFEGFRYTPTARFNGEDEPFSVVVEFPRAEPAPKSGFLRLLNPALTTIDDRLRTGATLQIMEGARVVAECVVENRNGG